MSQQIWERMMGMGGYRGSPAEREDRAEGIKADGEAYVKGLDLKGRITGMTIGDDGEPKFTLEFEDQGHGPVTVGREDLRAVAVVEAPAPRP
jgi:hypothetical protein